MVCNWVAFTKTTGIMRTAKTTKATQTTTSMRVECWIGGNHGNHRYGETHRNLVCKTWVPQKKGLEISERGKNNDRLRGKNSHRQSEKSGEQ